MNVESKIYASSARAVTTTREHMATLMTNPFIRKLAQGAELSSEDRGILLEIIRPAFKVERRRHLFREHDTLHAIFLILEGWACRYKMLPDGRRQVVGFLIPGDLSDMDASALDKSDHSVAMLSSGQVVAIAPETMRHAIDYYPAIARALNWTASIQQAVMREWLTSLGQRDAFARIAHLFCELWLRMTAIGLAKGQSFALPLTQVDLGDTLGLTSVHVNRQLQIMRNAGLITLERQILTIHDPSKLVSLCGFDASYLQKGGELGWSINHN